MNLFKRWLTPTPKKYQKWGKLTKNISYALGLGLAGAALVTLPTTLLTVIGIVIFITASISGFCYAQIEEATPVITKTV